MNLKQLYHFVSLYNLGSLVESVKLTVKDNVLSTSFVADDKSMAGTVIQKSFTFEDTEFGIWSTADFKVRTKALADEVDMSFVKNKDKPVAMTLTDKEGIDVNFMLADLTVIPAAPKVKSPTTFEVEIPIDAKFINQYLKAKASIPDADSFTLLMNKKDALELVIGWAPSINTDQIKIAVTPTAGFDKVVDPISFNANYLREILSANSDVTGAVLKVSTKGLAVLTFDTSEFSATYYLVQKKLES